MFKNTYFFLVLIVLLGLISCKNTVPRQDKIVLSVNNNKLKMSKPIVVGANRLKAYLPLIKDKRVAVVANQTSVIFKKDKTHTHLVDSLLRLQVNVIKVFSPEHGFRGQADAGEHVANGIDISTGLALISLYGKNKKPTAAQLKNIDIVIFDIQDVGVRFYTYISTLHYVMEACAEAHIPVIVLDRPNPNAHYIDGPVLEPLHKSFVGMHPVPLVYGMTIGEYAQMINGENWLKNGVKCDLKVIDLKNYSHKTFYTLPIKPSPNLPNAKAVNLYPSLALFEGTVISCGRGTEMQFQIFGAPFLPNKKYDFGFTPQSNFGAKYPKFKGLFCNGLDLRKTDTLNQLNLKWLIDAYKSTKNKSQFFNKFFTKLAGTKKLQQQIEQGLSEKHIKKKGQKDLEAFKKIRAHYLIYKE
ncbi:MAG: DUF1343 domain-containing protein [Flavobacteriaceae bacterium]|nr:DUF1343 domain-containing protein [Flavobacteriaceae bacterium]